MITVEIKCKTNGWYNNTGFGGKGQLIVEFPKKIHFWEKTGACQWWSVINNIFIFMRNAIDRKSLPPSPGDAQSLGCCWLSESSHFYPSKNPRISPSTTRSPGSSWFVSQVQLGYLDTSDI